MRVIILLPIILLCSCKNKKEIIVNRQQAIIKEMEQVKTSFYKKSDSLKNVKQADTSSVKSNEIAKELVSVDEKKIRCVNYPSKGIRFFGSRIKEILSLL